ncbi:MAG: EAL domain-containing protein [Terricaulis sp.]
MFRHLRLKLTVLYAGLFCIALAFIAAGAFAVVNGNSERMVREQLKTTGIVFDRVWQLRFQRLEDSATLSSSDYGFRQAVATADAATLASALSNLRERLDADVVFLVAPEGLVYSPRGLESAPASDQLHAALETEEAPTGVLMIGGALHQAVSAPIYAPNLLGWVIVAERLDAAEMRALERLSAIPLNASAMVRASNGAWVSSEGAAETDTQIDTFIDRTLRAGQGDPDLLAGADGPAMALVKPFRSLDGTASVLMLRYPMALALAPYRALFSTLLAIGIIALCLLVIATWLLARGITQPISTLEEAARRLQAGEHVPVKVRSRDEIARLAESFNAMAAAIQLRERKITQLAFHDSETRLPNRAALERRLVAMLKQPRGFVVVAIGIDRFAHMRGAIGYAHASSFLQQLGVRLTQLAPNAPMARLSNDVLAVALLADNDSEALRRVQGLLANLEQSLRIDEQVVDVNVTIGVAAPEGKAASPGDVIEHASIALDQARAARAKIAFFDKAAYGDPTRNLSLMGDMHRAMDNGEIGLFYQLKMDFRSNTIESAEALVRWRHPRRGMISPDLFVPMAEETGHVRALTEWVLARAVEEQGMLADAGFPLAISVNISGRLVGDRDFAHAALAAVKGARHDLCFEITETAVIDNPEIALENIELFARHGIKIAIDDYGSGLSSLSYLKQMPAHELKIDKVFVQSLVHSQRDALLVRSTIELAHGLGMRVTAEGVETPTTFALLASMGCDMAQGYFVARPAAVGDVIIALGDARRAEAAERAGKASA